MRLNDPQRGNENGNGRRPIAAAPRNGYFDADFVDGSLDTRRSDTVRPSS